MPYTRGICFDNEMERQKMMTKQQLPQWVQNDGQPVSCREKLKVLNENYHELSQVIEDAWQDALVMRCDPRFVRQIFHDLIDHLITI